MYKTTYQMCPTYPFAVVAVGHFESLEKLAVGGRRSYPSVVGSADQELGELVAGEGGR